MPIKVWDLGKNAWRRFGVLKWINKLAWKFGKQLHKSKEHLSHFEILAKKKWNVDIV